jgi:autotransporter-associated beta strand protein
MNTTTTKRAARLAAIITLIALPLRAENYYWDLNGNGAWDSGQTAAWAATAAGGAPSTAATTAADTVYFSANGITAGTITIAGTQLANSLYLNQAFNFIGGAIDLNLGASGTLFVGASGTIGSTLKTKGISFTVANQTLTLTGGGDFGGGAILYGANSNTGSVILNSGSYSSNSRINFGNPATGVGGLVINAGASLSLAPNTLSWLGYGADGFATLNGGMWNNSSGMVIGRTNAGKLIVNSGTLNVTGANSLNVGWNGRGSMDVTGGEVNADQLAIGANTKSVSQTGTMTIIGGVVNTGTVNFGWGYGGGAGVYTSDNGNGTLLLKGGRLNVGVGGLIKTGVANYTADIILSGGTLGTTGTAAWISDMNMTLSNADGGVTFDADQNITLGGILDGDGGFSKTGAGTLLLSGANTYAGDTVVNAGVLELGNAAALGLDADLSLLSGATVVLNYSGDLQIDHLLLDGVIISNLTVDTAYNAAALNAALGSSIFSGNGQLTIGAIPEPSVRVLLAIGFGILAISAFAKRKIITAR